jgi:hypothetical protein
MIHLKRQCSNIACNCKCNELRREYSEPLVSRDRQTEKQIQEPINQSINQSIRLTHQLVALQLKFAEPPPVFPCRK